MRRISYADQALTDIESITQYIAGVSGERSTAERFVGHVAGKMHADRTA